MKQQYPSTTQANLIFLLTILTILAGSIIIMPKIGIGSNLWINEFVWILSPVLVLTKFKGWKLEKIFCFRKTTNKNKLISILSGISIWFFAFYLSMMIRFLLDTKFGVISSNPATDGVSVNQSILLLIGMVILAPICEEIFFRGLVQQAYDRYNRKYGFVFAALIFGMFHMMNGVSEVIPACIIGLVLGYLVYRTGSIATSMLAHAANNLSSIVFGGAFALTLTGIPIWLHLLGLAGLGMTILLLTNVKARNVEEADYDEPMDKKFSIKSTIILAVAGLLLMLIGASELIARLGIIKV